MIYFSLEPDRWLHVFQGFWWGWDREGISTWFKRAFGIKGFFGITRNERKRGGKKCHLLGVRFGPVFLFFDVFFSSCFFSGVISCILHSQWRIWSRPATNCQYLHELAEASRVLRWKSYAKQAPLCHWMCCWIWTKLSQTDAYLDGLQRNEPVPTR